MTTYSPLAPMKTAGLAAVAALGLAVAPAAEAQAPADVPTLAPRDVPAKSLPVPTTVSPQMQKIIAAPLRAGWDVIPKTPEGWQASVKANAAATIATLPAMRERLHVTVKATTIGGVKAYIVTPDVIPPRNRNRLIIQVHGGCYVVQPGRGRHAGSHHDGGIWALQGDLGGLPDAAGSVFPGGAG